MKNQSQPKFALPFIGKPSDQIIFLFLWNEYIARIENGESDVIPFTCQELSALSGIDRRGVKKSLDHLEKIEIIYTENKGCEINTEKFIALCEAFNTIDKEDIETFTQAVNEDTVDRLYSLNYLVHTELNEEMYKNVHPCTKMYMCAKMHMENVQKCTCVQKCTNEMYKNVHGKCAKMHIDDENIMDGEISSQVMCKNAHECTFLYIYGEKSPSQENLDAPIKMHESVSDFGQFRNALVDASAHIIAKLKKLYTCTELSELFHERYSDIFPDHTVSHRCIENIYYGKETIFSPVLMLLANLEDDGFEEDPEWERENADTDEGNDDDLDNDFNDDDELPDRIHGSFPEIKIPEINPFQIKREAYERAKLRSRIPWMTVRDAEMCIESPDLICDRTDHIFIFHLWDCIKDLLVHEEEDDNGNIVDVHPDPENQYLFDYQLELAVREAFNATNEAIEDRRLSCWKGTFEVTATSPLTPEEVDDIIGFQEERTEENVFFKISKKRFRDISAGIVKGTRKPEGMCQADYNAEYLRQIIKLGDDEARYQELTTMELFVYNFLIEFYDITDEGHIRDYKPEYIGRARLNQRALGRYFLEHDEVKLDDFMTVLNRPHMDNGCLSLRISMFSADGIQEWNDMHQEKSVIRVDFQEAEGHNA